MEAIHGDKLRGGWMLVRTGKEDKRQWLLFKERDDQARPMELLRRAAPGDFRLDHPVYLNE